MNKQKQFIFFTGFLPILNAKEALFMSYMMYKLTTTSATEDWFIVTADEVSLNTGLSRTQQVAIKKRLYEVGFIETERRGTPPKNWYTITDKINPYFPEFL